MNTVARPRGPLPPRVYWVRRLALLAVALLVGWLMLRWIDGGGSGATPPDNQTPAAATQSEQPAKTKHNDSRHKGDQERTAEVSTVAESFQRPQEECDLTQVSVVPSVSDQAYAGEPVQMTLRVSSASSSACSLSLDADHLLVAISEGNDVVWDSTHCADEVPVRDLALQPQWSTVVDFTWSGLHSGRRCTPDSTPAESGKYIVQAAVLEGEPSEADFELAKPPEPPADQSDGKGKTDSKGSGDSADQPSDQPTDGATPSDQPTDGATPSDQPTDGATPSDSATKNQT